MVTIRRSRKKPEKTPWWWIGGDTRPHKDLLKEHGARWSRKRKQWYLIAEELPVAIQSLADEQIEIPAPAVLASRIADVDEGDPCSIEEASKILGLPVRAKADPPGDIRETPVEANAEEEEKPSIRILAAPQDEDFKEELRKLKVNPPALPVETKQSTGGTKQIPQAYCGELTGSITGQVRCYGWCVHRGTLIYLNMAGPKIATEAIRASLAQGKIVNLLPEDEAAIELTAGEGNTGMYTDFLSYIPSAKIASRILLHERLIEANYGGKSTTYLIQVTENQAKAQLKHHVSGLVNIAVFDDWSDYLWRAGRQSKLIQETRSGGGIEIYGIDLDIDAWSRLISGGLSEKIIRLPGKAV